MMKKLICSFLLLAAFIVSAAECRRHNQAYVNPLERGEPYLLKNEKASYVITFRYTNPTPERPAFLQTCMPAPVNKTGFSRMGFTHITLNGIDSRLLEPKKYETFQTPQSAGVDVYYNFDGIPMIQRFAISDFSPLLELSWRCGKSAEKRIRTLSIGFTVLPCAAGETRDSYSREIVSPFRKYVSTHKFQKHPLTKRDSHLILQDGKYQCGMENSYAAPVLLCPDWSGIQSGSASFGSRQDMSLEFELNPSAQYWNFRLFDSNVKRSNAAFAEYLEKQRIIHK